MVTLEGEVEFLKKNKQLVEQVHMKCIQRMFYIDRFIKHFYFSMQYREQLTEVVIERDDLARRIQAIEKEVEELKGLNNSLSTGQQQRLEVTPSPFLILRIM